MSDLCGTRFGFPKFFRENTRRDRGEDANFSEKEHGKKNVIADKWDPIAIETSLYYIRWMIIKWRCPLIIMTTHFLSDSSDLYM